MTCEHLIEKHHGRTEDINDYEVCMICYAAALDLHDSDCICDYCWNQLGAKKINGEAKKNNSNLKKLNIFCLC